MMGYAAVAGLAVGVGYLIWRGSGSVWKAIAGGVLLPLLAFIVLGALIGKEAMQNIGGAFVFILVVAIIIGAVLANKGKKPSA